MAPSREIEKLQRRWQENPLGLTFAPLAEAYRKEGMYEDALELLEIGLTQHPNYIPAHIVRGRCHLDTRSDAAAEAAFHRVLDLDPENVIALKGLAEIAERAGRFEDANRHLDHLLAVDRNNDDARAQLDRVRSQLAAPPEVASVEPVAAAEWAAGPPEELTEEPPAEPAPLVAEAAAVEPPAQPLTEWLEVHLEMVEEAPDEADRVEEPVSAPAVGEVPAPAAEPPPVPEPALEAEPAPAEVAAEVESEATELDIVLFESIDLRAGEANEYQPPSDAERLEAHAEAEAMAPPTEEEPAPWRDEAPAPVPFEEDLAAPEPEAAAPPAVFDLEPEPEPAIAEPAAPPAEAAAFEAAALAEAEAWTGPAEPEPEPEPEEMVTSDGKGTPAEEPELVVTETMAEIFLRQGHRELALAVYTQLSQREPANERIGQVKARLEAELRPAAAAPPVYAAALTGGQSVRGFFEQLLGAPRPDRPDEGPSLEAVFGDEAATPPDAATEPAEPGPSYDEFFGDQVQSQAPASPTPPSEPTRRPSSEVEDIEEFNTWLRGLKR